MNRLERLCTIFKWQGGTIFDAQLEAETCLEEELNILSMTDSEFDKLCLRLEKQYPAWLNYKDEMLADYASVYGYEGDF